MTLCGINILMFLFVWESLVGKFVHVITTSCLITTWKHKKLLETTLYIKFWVWWHWHPSILSPRHRQNAKQTSQRSDNPTTSWCPICLGKRDRSLSAYKALQNEIIFALTARASAIHRWETTLNENLHIHSYNFYVYTCICRKDGGHKLLWNKSRW